MCLNHLTLFLPCALILFIFDPHYPFGVLYKEPLGYIEGEELKSKKTVVHCCHSLLILESASLCPFGELCFLPKIFFACEIPIEVVEAQVED